MGFFFSFYFLFCFLFSFFGTERQKGKKKINQKEKRKKKKSYIVEFRFVEVSFSCKLNTFIGFILVLVTFEKCGIYI